MRRLMLVLGGIAGVSALLTAAACSSTSEGGAATDGGSDDAKADVKRDGQADPDEDVNVPLPPPSGTALAAGDVFLVGVTTDNDVIFLAATSQTNADLYTIPVAGGTATKIVTDTSIANDVQIVRGNTVLYWSGTSAGGVGAFNYWTKAGGNKTNVASNSVAGLIGAKADGTKVLYTANATVVSDKPTKTEVGYLDVTTGTATPAISGADSLNVAAAIAPSSSASAPCLPVIRFGGDTAFLAYCVGDVATENKARITSILAGTATRLDSATLADPGTVQPLMAVDVTGSTILSIGLAPDAKGRVIKTAGGAPGTTLEDGVIDTGYVINNGQGVIFHNPTKALHYDTTGAAPASQTSLVADAKTVKSIPRLSADQTHLVVSYLPPVSNSGVNLFDLHIVDTTTAQQPGVDLVATAGAFAFQFLTDNTTLIYVDELSSAGGKLKSVPIAGGTPKVLQTGAAGARIPTAGKGVLAFVNGQQGAVTGNTLFDITWSTDAPAGTQAAALETLVVPDSVIFAGNKIVYQREGDTDPNANAFGIFAIDLPQ